MSIEVENPKIHLMRNYHRAFTISFDSQLFNTSDESVQNARARCNLKLNRVLTMPLRKTQRAVLRQKMSSHDVVDFRR